MDFLPFNSSCGFGFMRTSEAISFFVASISSLDLVMAKPDLKGIDPLKIYMHARGFYLAEEILSNVDLNNDPQMGMEISEAGIVLSALNIELFLKCMVCIETGLTPQGHFLDRLYSRVSDKTRQRIESIWTNELVPHRDPMWKKMETQIGNGETLKRDLPSAIRAGNRAFEKIRYNYESGDKDTQFYISDLPKILGRVILELKPDWERVRRTVKIISAPQARDH